MTVKTLKSITIQRVTMDDDKTYEIAGNMVFQLVHGHYRTMVSSAVETEVRKALAEHRKTSTGRSDE